MAVIDSYSESNSDGTSRSLANDASTSLSQSFTGDGRILSSVQPYLIRTGSPTLNIFAKIYALTGTFGSTGTPTGAALATSDAILQTSISTSLGLVQFNFTGANQITLTNGTNYFIALDYTGNNSAAFSRYITWNGDGSSPSHAGNAALSSGTWSADTTIDFCFYVNGNDQPITPPIAWLRA